MTPYVYDTAHAHLLAWLYTDHEHQPVNSIVFHRDMVPALPGGCYAVVSVEIKALSSAPVTSAPGPADPTFHTDKQEKGTLVLSLARGWLYIVWLVLLLLTSRKNFL